MAKQIQQRAGNICLIQEHKENELDGIAWRVEMAWSVDLKTNDNFVGIMSKRTNEIFIN